MLSGSVFKKEAIVDTKRPGAANTFHGKCEICKQHFPRMDLTTNYSHASIRWESLTDHTCLRNASDSGHEEKVDVPAFKYRGPPLPTDDDYIDWAEAMAIMGPDIKRRLWVYQQLYCECMGETWSINSCPYCSRSLPVFDLTHDTIVRLECFCKHNCTGRTRTIS